MPVRKRDYKTLRADFDGLVQRAREKQTDALKSFMQFKPDVAQAKQKELIARHQQDTLIGCEGLSADVALALQEAERAHYVARYPSLSSTDPAQKQYGATEFNSAQLVGELYPLDLVRESYQAGRVDFSSALCERALSQPTPNSGEGIMQRAEFQRAVSKLYGERLDGIEAERNGLRKLTADVQEFTQRVSNDFDVDVLSAAMKAAYPPGQQQTVTVRD